MHCCLSRGTKVWSSMTDILQNLNFRSCTASHERQFRYGMHRPHATYRNGRWQASPIYVFLYVWASAPWRDTMRKPRWGHVHAVNQCDFSQNHVNAPVHLEFRTICERISTEKIPLICQPSIQAPKSTQVSRELLDVSEAQRDGSENRALRVPYIWTENTEYYRVLLVDGNYQYFCTLKMTLSLYEHWINATRYCKNNYCVKFINLLKKYVTPFLCKNYWITLRKIIPKCCKINKCVINTVY